MISRVIIKLSRIYRYNELEIRSIVNIAITITVIIHYLYLMIYLLIYTFFLKKYMYSDQYYVLDLIEVKICTSCFFLFFIKYCSLSPQQPAVCQDSKAKLAAEM